jgi:hypothetical protein
MTPTVSAAHISAPRNREASDAPLPTPMAFAAS